MSAGTRRVLPWIVLGALALGCAVPAALHGRDTDDAPPALGGVERTLRLNTLYEVADDGDMQVTETLVVDVGDQEQPSLTRSFDESNPDAPRLSRAPEELAAVVDGRPADLERHREHLGRYTVAEVDDRDGPLAPGEHTLVLRHRVDDVLLADGDDSSTFRWDLVPQHWPTPVDRAELTVRMPEAPEDVRCDAAQECRTRVDGSTVTVRLQDLSARSPVTLRAQLPEVAAGSDDALPWPVALRPVLGGSPTLLLLVGVCVLWAGWLGRRVAGRGFAPLDVAAHPEPPPGLGPAQAAYVLDGRTTGSALVATLLHAVATGALEVRRVGPGPDGPGGWELVRRSEGDAALRDPALRAALMALLPEVDVPVVLGRGDEESAAGLRRVHAALDRQDREWAVREGLLVRSGWRSWAGVGVVSAFVLFGVLLVALRADMTAVALVPGAFAALALPVLLRGATTKPTTAGQRLRGRAAGYRRALCGPETDALRRVEPEEPGERLAWAAALCPAGASTEGVAGEVSTLADDLQVMVQEAGIDGVLDGTGDADGGGAGGAGTGLRARSGA